MKHCGIWVVVSLGVLASNVHAEDFALVRELEMPAPEAGMVAAAKPQAPTWCKNVEGADQRGRNPRAWSRTITSGMSDPEFLIEAAAMACLWETNPETQRGVQVILQVWMNRTGMSQVAAVESLTLRVQKSKFKEDREKLCNALVTPSEIEGEEKYFMLARKTLFCSFRNEPQWAQQNKAVAPELAAFLDMSTNEPDELVRLASVIAHNSYVFAEATEYSERKLVSYVSQQLDLKAISDVALNKVLATPPFAGNRYARAVGIESEAYAQMIARSLKKVVDERTAKDADWKSLLVSAPEKAVADWTAMAAKYKAQIARSNEFEQKFWGASKKAVAGCWPTLRKDFVDVVNDQKHGNANELKEALNNPIAALLFSRVVACASLDQDALYAGSLIKVARDVRFARGRRTAAYYGALEAIGPIMADRAKFPVAAKDLDLYQDRSLIDRAYNFQMDRKSEINSVGWVGDAGEGTVKTVKKHAKGTEITFVTTKVQVMGRSCTPTNRILMFRTDGSPLYYENCKDTGFYTVNTTPMTIVLPVAEWAQNIKPGAVMSFEAAPNYDAPFRLALPTYVYADKSKKKLISFAGFALN